MTYDGGSRQTLAHVRASHVELKRRKNTLVPAGMRFEKSAVELAIMLDYAFRSGPSRRSICSEEMMESMSLS